MKRILYLISLLGLFLTLQSCDRISNLFNDDDSTTQQVDDSQQQDESANKEDQTSETKDKVTTVEMQSQLQQNEDGIKALKDSLENLKMKLTNLQNDMTALQQQQTEINNDKVGVKNLFIYLAIFTIVAVVLIVLLTKKITRKNSLTRKDVEDIITDFAEKHPDRINGSMQLELYQLSTQIKNINQIDQDVKLLKQDVNNLKYQVNTKAIQQNNEPQATSDGSNRPHETTRGVFYMKRPSGDMEWDLSLKSETQTEETFYRFEIDRRRPNIAHFTFDCITSARVSWALTTRDITINRACIATVNSRNGRYLCTREGEAELRGGKWVVTRKAEVTFE